MSVENQIVSWIRQQCASYRVPEPAIYFVEVIPNPQGLPCAGLTIGNFRMGGSISFARSLLWQNPHLLWDIVQHELAHWFGHSLGERPGW